MGITKELPVLSIFTSNNNADLQGGPIPRDRPISPSKAAQILPLRKPEWLKIKPPAGPKYASIKKRTAELGLHTVCQEAKCPNLAECWSSGTATFMLGGDICTRACRFCAVKTARIPPPLNPDEPVFLAESIEQMELQYIVLTSVDRDDLEDGGAQHFATSIVEIRKRCPDLIVEALVPDFRGKIESVETIVNSGLHVYAHNIETVRRLHYRVRDPRADYDQSLAALKYAKLYARSQDQKIFTKSSIMLGFGETSTEIAQTAQDLRNVGVDVLTLGQYLRPTLSHLPVEKFWSPAEFEDLGNEMRQLGFLYVASGPMVRSSYKAAEFYLKKEWAKQPSTTTLSR